MNIKELTIGQIEEIERFFNKSKKDESDNLSTYGVGQICIFRTYSAGVFYGELINRSGTEAFVKNAKRIWNWSGAFTLSEISIKGPSSAKISTGVDILLTQVIEVIPCQKKAIDKLESIGVYNV